MPLVPDATVFQERLAGLPVLKCQGGETVLSAGSADGKLLVLRSGAVEVLKDGVQIAKVSAPGAVFGELAVLLGQSHTADVRTHPGGGSVRADHRSQAMATADHHHLFGLLALQVGLIDQAQLVAAFHAWTRDKARPLADHLRALGHLDDEQRGLVEALAAQHLKG